MSRRDGVRQWAITVALVALFLFICLSQVEAETIYSLEWLFAPALSNQASTTFTGTMTFPGPTVQNGFISLQLADEQVPRDAAFQMTLNLPGSVFQPWDTRLYAGEYGGEPFTMLSLDYGMTAGTELGSEGLDTVGWDGWLVSFPDYPAGSISKLAAVNEPCGQALLAIGALIVLGLLRGVR